MRRLLRRGVGGDSDEWTKQNGAAPRDRAEAQPIPFVKAG